METIFEKQLGRDETIQAIKTALKNRSGKAWSVTGGRGTAWGWIRISAPPARRTGRWVLKENQPDIPENYELKNTGGSGEYLTPEDRKELADLLSLDKVHCQGVSIPAGSDYYREYVDRAQGREPSQIGKPYWD